jgi:hypothetical protein
MRRVGVLITASAAALLFASAAAATVHLVRLTSPVAPESEATLTARVLPRGVSCSITVNYKSGPSHAAGLFPKRPSPTGRVSWTWTVGTSTTPGRWPIVVSCGQAGTLHTAIRVGGKGTGGSGAPPKTTGVGRTVLLGRRTNTRGCRRGVLPDRRCSPGGYYAKLTKPVICGAGFHTSAIRNVPQSEKFAVEREYGMAATYYGYSIEIDHIVPLELGGSNSIANLFPEPGSGRDNYHFKDQAENRAKEWVCEGRLSLAAARRDFATNWEKLYRRLFGHAPTG